MMIGMSPKILPFEKLVQRQFDRTQVGPVQVLLEYFKGPTPEEAKAGLINMKNGSNSFYLEVDNGVAHVHLKVFS